MHELLLLVLILGLLWLAIRVYEARNTAESLNRRLARLEADVFRLKGMAFKAPPASSSMPAPAPEAEPEIEPALEAAPAPPLAPVLPPPPPIFIPQPAEPEPAAEPEPVFAKAAPAINWEQFMGVKMFAWLGGLALFLGVAFFVKYSFDNNLVPPELRAATGFLAGIGLLVGGGLMSRKNYPALSQTLCATGVVILYAVTFACRSIYHFQFFGPLPTFLLMVLITAAAFLLAVRLNALVVAILGLLGGFITPVLLSTGQDNPFGLFAYLALLDIGLVLVALHRRWHFLIALSAFSTVLMQLGWAAKFFVEGKYFEGGKIFTPITVLLGFQLLYLGAAVWTKKRRQANWWITGTALSVSAVALIFASWFLSFDPLAQRPALMFSFVFIVDAIMAAIMLAGHAALPAQPIIGLAVFGLLGEWTINSLNGNFLNTALACYFIFAVAHTVFPLVLQRRFRISTASWGGHIFPALALILVLVPIFKFAEVSFVVWPFIFLVDLLAIGMAVALGSVISVVAVLLLTLAATGTMIFKIPAALPGFPGSFLLLALFSAFFVAASIWLARRFKPNFSDPAQALAAQLPVLSAVLPFLLLIMAALRLPLADPSPLFGIALLLTILLLGVAKLLSIELLPAAGLVCVSAVEFAWHFNRFVPAGATVPLLWYLGFFAVFTIFPFLFLRTYAGQTLPWAASALAGLPQFFLVHRLVGAAYPNQFMGALPAAFAIVPLVELVVVLRKIPPANPARLNQLAWFGGMALFFITLIFPIQFDRQWITIGWALEGVALLWLFHRVPHPGLRWIGAGLLAAAFARLALNPAVIEYHTRSSTPIFNWYLYAYSTVAICLFAGARLAPPSRQPANFLNLPPLLTALGTILTFLLLNIEIADFFSSPGSTLTFEFSGNFARDMTYSIAWAIFALVLLVIGILRKLAPARYAALVLLSVTLLKLFLHDLAQLGPLYRIGAFISVAVIAMVASFCYQRFFSANPAPKEKNETTPQTGI